MSNKVEELEEQLRAECDKFEYMRDDMEGGYATPDELMDQVLKIKDIHRELKRELETDEDWRIEMQQVNLSMREKYDN